MDTAELVQDLKANIGVAPAAETQEAASGGAHRCSKCPGECVAAPGATQRHGITDAACAKCAKGYKWWPCQESGQCRCADASSVLEEDEEEAPAPTAMVASLPMSLDLVAALDCPTGAARSAAGDCQCPEGQVLSADSSACQEATTEASPDVTYAAAGNWNACGGISFCGDDKVIPVLHLHPASSPPPRPSLTLSLTLLSSSLIGLRALRQRELRVRLS